MLAAVRPLRRWSALLTALVVLCGTLLGASPTWASSVDSGAVFNNPLGTKEARMRILRTIEAAIDGTCPGGCAVPGQETILVSTYLMDRGPTASKLIAAHNRGVNVQIVMDSAITAPASDRLVEALGPADKNGDHRVNAADIDPLTGQHSFAIKCKDSCRGGWGSNHDKFYAFTHTGDTSNVVMVSSANLNYGGALAGWNDLYAITERPDVYDLYRRVHGEMAEDDPPDLDGKPIERFYIEESPGGDFVHRFFPRKRAGRDLDPTYQQLDKIRCKGATDGAGAGGRTVVKIAMFWWSGARGVYLADKVIGLDRAGCDVQVNYGAPSNEVSRMLRASAHSGGVKLWDSRQRKVDGKPTLRVHHKYMIVSGRYGDDTSDWRVMAGTQNWIEGALTGSDENTLEIPLRSAYASYSSEFESLKRYSRRIR